MKSIVSTYTQPNTMTNYVQKWFLCAISCVFLFLSACSSNLAIIDYDTTQDFSQFKTYRWATNDETASSNQKTTHKKNQTLVENNTSIPHQDLLSKRVKRNVNSALQAQQISLNIIQPDFLISQQITTQTNYYHDYYSPFDIYLGGCSSRSIFCGGTTLRNGDIYEYQYTELYLVLRFLKPENSEVLWQGIVELPKNTSAKSAEAYDQEIALEINKLIKRFPLAAHLSP